MSESVAFLSLFLVVSWFSVTPALVVESYTMAPELLKGGYTSLVDCWSLGVIMFMLLSSSMPFYGKDR